MANPFVDIVKEANRLKWCTMPHCTTCGAMEYRQALKKLAGDLGGPLADALIDLDIKEVTKLANWQGALPIAVLDLPLSLQVESVLNAWIIKAGDDDIDFLDAILFNVVKNLPSNNSLRNQWISRCVGLALRAKHSSLIESLILVLKKEALGNSELMEIATSIAVSSKQMRRVLLNACGLEINNN